MLLHGVTKQNICEGVKDVDSAVASLMEINNKIANGIKIREQMGEWERGLWI